MDNSPENPLLSLIRQIVTGPDVLRQQQAQQQQVQQRQSKPQGAPGPPRPAGTQGPPAPDKPKPKPKPNAGKQRQVAEYQREASSPRAIEHTIGDTLASTVANPGFVPLPTPEAAQNIAHNLRIATGHENWQPLVGETTPRQKQFYKDQRRLAEQQERGVFGQRLPKRTAKEMGVDSQANSIATAGKIHAKGFGGPVTGMEGDATRRPGASEGEQMLNVALALSGGRGLSRALRGRIGVPPEVPPDEGGGGPPDDGGGGGGGVSAKAGRQSNRGKSPAQRVSEAEGAAAKTRVKRLAKDTPADARAVAKENKRPYRDDTGKLVRPPKGEAIGTNVPKKEAAEPKKESTVQDVADAGKARANNERPPLPKAEEKPKTTRAADAAKKERKAKVNDATSGPGPGAKKPVRKPRTPPKADTPAPKTDTKKNRNLADQLQDSIKADKAKKSKKTPTVPDTVKPEEAKLAPEVKAFRDKLPVNYQSRFDKMTPEQQKAYYKKYGPKE